MSLNSSLARYLLWFGKFFSDQESMIFPSE